MSQQISLLIVSLHEYRFALPAAQVQRVLRAAAVTPVPDSPTSVHGILDLQGRLLPVVSGRLTFGIGARPIEPEDCFVVLSCGNGSFVLVVDRVVGVSVVPATDFIFNGSSSHGADESSPAHEGSQALLGLSDRMYDLARHSTGSLPYAVRIEGELVLLFSADSIANELWDSAAAMTIAV